MGLALAVVFSAQAQKKNKKGNEEPYQFTEVKVIPNTSVKDQNRSGTCWSFSGISFLESEVLRIKGDTVDLSDMYPVFKCYELKGDKYVRMHGRTELATGGASNDVADVLKVYGMVPEEVYPGLNYGVDAHDHSELDAVLVGFLKGVVKGNKPTTAWRNAYVGILEAYLGEDPETFTYNGKEYTPQSFAEELGLNMDDYVSITSFTHHPFYTQFAVEVPDNWAWGLSYNVPLEEMMEIIDNALLNGYSVEWAADVSEPGFQYSKGFAVIPAGTSSEASDLEWAKWETMSSNSRRAMIAKATEPIEEMEITQELRQEGYDNYETTDDHGMLITGIFTDQNGNTFYKVKNSWDVSNIYDGYFFASAPFVAYKTMNIVVHKNAIPKDIRKELGIK